MSDAPAVSVRVPGLLARFTDGQRTVTVHAETVAGVVEILLETYPALEPHLLDGRGALRAHVQLFHEGSAVDGLGTAEHAVETGDEIVVLQAVSGG
jgi:molybdopterin converting factor small subunit